MIFLTTSSLIRNNAEVLCKDEQNGPVYFFMQNIGCSGSPQFINMTHVKLSRFLLVLFAFSSMVSTVSCIISSG